MQAQVLRDLIATLRNAETQLQQRLAGADRAAATMWARQTLVHATHASEEALESLESVDRDLGESSLSGKIAYSVEPLVRKIGSRDVRSDVASSRGQSEFEAIAALLRCTHLRIADLTLLRLALRSGEVEPSAQKISATVEDAYLSAERLRDYAVRLLNAEANSAGGAMPEKICLRCLHWRGDPRSGDSRGPCGHPDLRATELMVSGDSGCRRYTAD